MHKNLLLIMGIVEEAFLRLFPDSAFNFEAQLSYSARFKPYNATVRKTGNFLDFSLSRSWEGVSEEIVIGLIQRLLVRILRRGGFPGRSVSHGLSSLNMQLYDDFIREVSEVAVPAGAVSDEKLESSFKRVNEEYFLNLMEKPQLKWGAGSFRKLASYDYHTNSITVSSLFAEAPERLLDYLVYHELLHKKLKFSSSNGRTIHHGSEFRGLEAQFKDSSSVEGEINSFLRRARRQVPRRRLAAPAMSWFGLLKLKL